MSMALRVRGLTKTYADGHRALRGVDLDVERGDFFALLGPNGAGKTTLIGITSSLVNKTSGKVYIFDKDIDTDFEDARTHIGLVPQEFNFPVFEPVIEVLVNQAGYYGMARRRAFSRAEEVLHQLGIWEKRHTTARNLSGGMKRRLMIARALMHEPELLILDEPTAGVDIELRRSMWDFLRRINGQGTTIILTTHYLEEAESLCRHIAIINRGELVENTGMKQLLSRLDTETFLLDIASPLGEPPRISGQAVRLVDEITLEVEIHKREGINALFAALSHLGIEVLSMRNKANRLEQLFMHLIGDSERRKHAP
ncbi:daunorubicin/doxorubicin resistance ATP-binding protein DrrA [bacterium BMS3Bbin12]|nr:daunorubicin/doxorubicin resistance ATP-binding protein DrrA [bacterium BMS3Abin12]GBE48919.1 daunorubicin/doxorubicin resistance ATP-binding protein DrrA [bacterium BMS3Bbin12]GBE49823.1 daunorubicin/doxorubicin resistance ATP-binding protein DrrA [bacterium BMS3Bbin13]HDK03445.1 ABC transporter ATP-binding protein [Gammaproteobacteria bacterium]